uniref:Uncharacterized protein n=1 Tax=Quercus lobata TaxID=97700 RepID=A0A7N2KVL4_QUELO
MLNAVHAKIAECQRQILLAGEMVEEAKHSLGLDVDGIKDGDAFLEKESEEIDRNEERVESIKAAFISALLRIVFGVTFRYTIRRDLDNIQLKTGTSAAFGFVKGLAMLGSGPP